MRVSFLEAADAEVDAALAWYADRSPVAAAGFLYELTKSIKRIVEAPHRYPKADHGTRKVRFDRFPYSIYIYYRASDDAIVVIAVSHAKRRPGYWAGRSRAG